MPRFSIHSSQRLAECDPRLQAIAVEVIKVHDFAVDCGHRDEADQEAAVARGCSKVHFPNSKHNGWPSKALDFHPCPLDWDDFPRVREDRPRLPGGGGPSGRRP